MTIQEHIKRYELAIKEAEQTRDNPSAPQAAIEMAERIIESMSNKLNELKSK